MPIKPETLLPLPPAAFHILVSLADQDRHGYAVMQEIALRTDGDVRLTAATLYRSIQRMLEQRLLIEVEDRPAPELDDERRRYYRLTPLGRAVVRAEAARLSRMVTLARAKGLAPEKR